MTMTLDIEIVCKCGCDLTACYNCDEITVEPCPDCIAEAKNEGVTVGYERGLKEREEEASGL